MDKSTTELQQEIDGLSSSLKFAGGKGLKIAIRREIKSRKFLLHYARKAEADERRVGRHKYNAKRIESEKVNLVAAMRLVLTKEQVEEIFNLQRHLLEDMEQALAGTGP